MIEGTIVCMSEKLDIGQWALLSKTAVSNITIILTAHPDHVIPWTLLRFWFVTWHFLG